MASEKEASDLRLDRDGGRSRSSRRSRRSSPAPSRDGDGHRHRHRHRHRRDEDGCEAKAAGDGRGSGSRSRGLVEGESRSRSRHVRSRSRSGSASRPASRHRSRSPSLHLNGSPSKRSRRSSRSRSSSRSSSRSRHGSHRHRSSRSKSPHRNGKGTGSKRKRASGFDVPPPSMASMMMMNGLAPLSASTSSPSSSSAAASSAVSSASQLPHLVAMASSNAGSSAAILPHPAHPLAQMVPSSSASLMMNPGLTNLVAVKHAKRVYVGRLPPGANEQSIAAFFNQVMRLVGAVSLPGDPVVNVYVNYDKNFAFVEMRTVEEASNAMALDGVIFDGIGLSVRRPTDYDPNSAALLGPIQPNPDLNLALVGLSSRSIVNSCPHKIFVGGLPHHFTEEEAKTLLESVGPIHGLDLVKDNDTGNSKGYAFCVYQDPSMTDYACSVLNGIKIGDRTLTVRRAAVGNEKKPEELQLQSMLSVPYNMLLGQLPAIPIGSVNVELPTKVLCLAQLVMVDELRDDQEYEDIYQDIHGECGKFGTIVKLVIPRPNPEGAEVSGLGKAFVEYVDTQSSIKAKGALNGRGFGGNIVRAYYYPEDKFARGEYNDAIS